jgi:uncharacterized membrane protein
MTTEQAPPELDLVVVRYRGEDGAATALADARARAGANARWANQVGLVEHYHSGKLALRGVFAGHYVDADESHHASESGAIEGSVVGGVIGVLGGPPGLAVGLMLGAILGSQVLPPTETEPEPLVLAERLREAVPREGSAIVMIASPHDVGETLDALADTGGEVTREKLAADQVAALEAALSDAPAEPVG